MRSTILSPGPWMTTSRCWRPSRSTCARRLTTSSAPATTWAAGVVLCVVVVLILSQIFHLLFPGRLSYLRRVILTIVGVLLGEAVAGRLLPGGTRLGELHPVWDVGFTTVLQLFGNRYLA